MILQSPSNAECLKQLKTGASEILHLSDFSTVFLDHFEGQLPFQQEASDEKIPLS